MSLGEKNGGKYSLFSTRLDVPALGPRINIDGRAPKPVYGVPSEMVTRDQIREASVPFGRCTQVVINKRPMGIITGSRVSQNLLVAINGL